MILPEKQESNRKEKITRVYAATKMQERSRSNQLIYRVGIGFSIISLVLIPFKLTWVGVIGLLGICFWGSKQESDLLAYLKDEFGM